MNNGSKYFLIHTFTKNSGIAFAVASFPPLRAVRRAGSVLIILHIPFSELVAMTPFFIGGSTLLYKI